MCWFEPHWNTIAIYVLSVIGFNVKQLMYVEKNVLTLITKENIEELVEWIVDTMDVSALEAFVKENLTDYYSSDDGMDDFENNYANMKEIVGDE